MERSGFFNALSLPHHFLCADCKGEMRDAFYNSTEVESLKWRPGKECCSSVSCKKCREKACEEDEVYETL